VANLPEARVIPNKALTGVRALVGDDEERVRALTKVILERAGCAVTSAEDGQEALDLLEADDAFDVLVTDVMMPRLGGIELAERIWAKWPGFAVLFITGFSDVELPRGSQLVRKPFTKDALMKGVDRVLGRAG